MPPLADVIEAETRFIVVSVGIKIIPEIIGPDEIDDTVKVVELIEPVKFAKKVGVPVIVVEETVCVLLMR